MAAGAARAFHIENLRKIFIRGVQSVQPASLFRENHLVRWENAGENRDVLRIKDDAVDLTGRKCHLVGFGKAVLGMAVQMERILGDRLKSGIISIPIGTGRKFSGVKEMQLRHDSVIQVYEGAKDNLPDADAMQAAVRIKKLAESMRGDDVLFVLISGGGSALLPLPVDVITLEEKLQLIQNLASAGASIKEINIVRIAISQIKGGKLAQAAKNAHKIVTLIISDIVRDPIDLIASGPTVPFVRRDQTAERILKKYELWNTLNEEVRNFIKNQPKDDLHLDNNIIHILGNNEVAVNACQRAAKELGYSPIFVTSHISENLVNLTSDYIYKIEMAKKRLHHDDTEDYMNTGFSIDHALKKAKDADPHKSICLILAGEPTNKVRGSGKGGRNQELALKMSLACYNNQLLDDVYFLSAGTDGIDGPTDAAGGIGCKDVILDFLKSGTIGDLEGYLENNDSYNFYKNVEGGRYHIVTGHTGTNVMDLHLIVIPR